MKSTIAMGMILFLSIAAIFAALPARAGTATFTFVPISPISDRTFFYGGSTMPVKFQLFDSAGNIASTATATIWVNGQPGTTNGGANTGNSFRFDSSSGLYIYNLSTKNLPVPGPNTITIMVSDGTSHTFIVTFH
jgi:hypothetical protein